MPKQKSKEFCDKIQEVINSYKFRIKTFGDAVKRLEESLTAERKELDKCKRTLEIFEKILRDYQP